MAEQQPGMVPLSCFVSQAVMCPDDAACAALCERRSAPAVLQVAARKADADRESRRRDRLEKEARELRALLESRQSDIAARNIQVGLAAGANSAGLCRPRVLAAQQACLPAACCYSNTVCAAAAAAGCHRCMHATVSCRAVSGTV